MRPGFGGHLPVPNENLLPKQKDISLPSSTNLIVSRYLSIVTNRICHTSLGIIKTSQLSPFLLMYRISWSVIPKRYRFCFNFTEQQITSLSAANTTNLCRTILCSRIERSTMVDANDLMRGASRG